MSFLVANATGAPPIWVKGKLTQHSLGCIPIFLHRKGFLNALLATIAVSYSMNNVYILIKVYES